MTTAQKNNRAGESGNVFFIIMIGIVLFAALMFTFSRGMRQGTESMSGREAELAASDIVAYGQKVQRGVQRLTINGISETDISFANPRETGYGNANCGNDKCLVFNPAGGAVAWRDAPPGVNSGDAYFFGPNRMGTADGITREVGTAERDLVMMLRVNATVCEAINGITSKHATWKTPGPVNTTAKFTGNYNVSLGTGISYGNDIQQPLTGCFCTSALTACDSADPHYYYNVILAR